LEYRAHQEQRVTEAREERRVLKETSGDMDLQDLQEQLEYQVSQVLQVQQDCLE
jgi:hypothetical protein